MSYDELWWHMRLFDKIFSVPAENLESALARSADDLPWADFLLNPRRLRGSDFLMRWSQGVWSEERVIQAVSETGRHSALPYGPSGVAPDDIRARELYFERLERAGLGKLKRPDLLIFKNADQAQVNTLIDQLGGTQEIPLTPEDDPRMRQLLKLAILAVECENSLWRAGQMPDYRAPLKPQKRLGGKPGLRKSAVLPTVILKEEDRKPLRDWQAQCAVSVHIWHVFYDMAFGIAMDEAERLIRQGMIEATTQVFQAPGGPTTQKTIYKIYHQYAYHLGDAQGEPETRCAHLLNARSHRRVRNEKH